VAGQIERGSARAHAAGSGGWRRADITPPTDRNDITDPADSADSSDATESDDPMLNAEAKDPTDPTDKKDPTDPMDRTDPRDPIDRKEFCDRSDHFDDEFMAAILPTRRSSARAALWRVSGHRWHPGRGREVLQHHLVMA
jgi:hypothetical protein